MVERVSAVILPESGVNNREEAAGAFVARHPNRFIICMFIVLVSQFQFT